MSNILLVSVSKSFMISSLAKQLEEQGHKIIFTQNDPSDISKIKEEVQMVLIYEEELDSEGLIYLKDKVIEESIPVFATGDTNQIAEIEKVIPKQFIIKNFLRPINVKEVVGEIDKYLREDSSQMKKKILVVDDSGAMLRNVKAWLQDKYQVILANSGAMAIKYLTLRCPDLILLDYEMPIVNGGQVMQMLRDDNEFKDIPIIFLTGKNDLATVQNIVNLKPDGYILKSKEPFELHKMIDDFFAQREKKSERE